MNNAALQELVNRGILPRDKIFIEIIESACLQPGSYLSVWNLAGRRIEFITTACKTITGYEALEFISGGPEFVFSITLTESIPSIVRAQTYYIDQAKRPDFDPCSVIIHEYPFDIRLALGYTRRLISLAVVLTYSPHADMEYGVAMVAEDVPEILTACRARLVSIKERHNQVYRHTPFHTRPDSLQKVPVNQQQNQRLTPREEDILKLLANGLTSVQIAKTLSIEENTVETHRKNILVKFGAKNIAELIKKASKVYWLD